MDPNKDSHFETIEPLGRDARIERKAAADSQSKKFPVGWLVVAVATIVLAAILLVQLPGLLDGVPAATADQSTDLIDEASDRIESQASEANRKRTEIFSKWLELENMDVSIWAELRAARALELLQDGERKISTLKYREALQSLDESDALLSALLEQAPGIAADHRQAGWQAFDSANAEAAREHFEIVLAINPDDTEVRQAMMRTGALDQLTTLARRARELEANGDLNGAIATLDEALLMDPDSETLQQDRARLSQQKLDGRFRSLMSQALAALAANDFQATGRALDEAGKLRPSAPEVRDARIRLEQTRKNRRIESLQQQANNAESNEDWEMAIERYSEMLQLDSTLVIAQQGRDRSRRLASLTTRAETLLADGAFAKKDIRDKTQSLLEQIDSVTSRSPKLLMLAGQLESRLQLAKVPVKVQLRSDQKTEVQVYRVGNLGQFDTRELSLLPGQYTVIGRRDGYRDVRAQLLIEPGQNPDPLMIRCEEQI